MRQEAVSPCSWGPGDTGDQSPRQVLFSTEPPPPVSPPCDEGPTTSGTKLHSSSCLGSRVTPTLPVPVAHPLIMPVEPAAGCATAGTVGPKFLLPGFTHHPNAACPSRSSPDNAGGARSGLCHRGDRGSSLPQQGHGCCPDSPPGIPPTPGPSAPCPAPCYLCAALGARLPTQLPVSRLGWP